MTAKRSRVSLCFATVLLCMIATRAEAVDVEDTFTGADSTNLGFTEVGGAAWAEHNTTGPATNVAEIIGGELRIHGFGGTGSSDPGLAVVLESFADLELSVDMRFDGLLNPTTGSTYNTGGLMLRRPSADVNITSNAGLGQIDIGMYPSGGFLIRENDGVGAGGATLTTHYGTSPFDGAIVVATLNNFAAPGTLPTTLGGQPFDADGDGILEENEPFTLGAVLIGDSLTIQLNGIDMFDVALLLDAPPTAVSFPALMKNRHTGGGVRDHFNPAFDNLVISGTAPPPPPPPLPILHNGSNSPLDEGWLSFAAGTVNNNGPIDDGGTAAWNIDDDGGGTRQAYTRSLTTEQLDEVAANGWRYRSKMRVVDVDDAPDGGIEMGVVSAASRSFNLWFGSDADGNTTLQAITGVGPLTLSDPVVLSPGYHDYEMIWNPTSQTANVYVDGGSTPALASLSGFNTSVSNRILWGSNAGGGTGESNWAYAEFETVPEPAAALLLMLGAAGAALMRRRRGNK